MNGKSTAKTPAEYLASLDEPRQSELRHLHAFIRKTVPAWKPHIRSGMIGYGDYQYRYASGRSGEWFRVGLASQKNYTSVYVCAADDAGRYLAEKHSQALPNASVGKSCIRFKRLADIDLAVLARILKEAVRIARRKPHGCAVRQSRKQNKEERSRKHENTK